MDLLEPDLLDADLLDADLLDADLPALDLPALDLLELDLPDVDFFAAFLPEALRRLSPMPVSAWFRVGSCDIAAGGS